MPRGILYLLYISFDMEVDYTFQPAMENFHLMETGKSFVLVSSYYTELTSQEKSTEKYYHDYYNNSLNLYNKG